MAVRVRVVRAGILHGVDFTVPGRGVTLVLGPNGAGKTTLLRVIAGLVKADAYVEVNGVRLDGLPPEERRVAYVPQSLALFNHMSVYDNVAYGLRARGLPEDVIEEKVLGIARRLGVEDLLDKMPWMLSGGEKQRVALARALVLDDTRIILLDEAFDHIDADGRMEIMQLVNVEAHRRGVPVILVTHHPQEAMEAMDVKAVIKLDRGKLVEKKVTGEVETRLLSLRASLAR